MVAKLIDRLKSKNIVALFLIFFCLAMLFSAGTAYIAYQIDPEFLHAGNLETLPLAEKIFVVLLIGPALETLLFQMGLIELLSRIFRKRYYGLIVCISGGLFGLAHGYNPVYVLVAFFMGIWFALFYLLIKEKTKSSVSAYWVLVLLHALINLMSFIPVFE